MEPLVIQLKLDSDGAHAELRKLAAEGGRAGRQIDEGLEGAGKQAKTLGEHVSSLITHQGYQLLRDAAVAMGQGFRETADYVKGISNEFMKLQDTLRIVAAFRGDRATGEFTAEQARMGAAAGLTPDKWAGFQKEFSGYAGQFIGEGAKFSRAQGDDLARRAAAFMNARGIAPSEGGAIFGEILQQAKGDESNDELMKRFGQAYAVLEPAKGDPGMLISQIGQVTAGGMSTGDAAKLMRATAQRSPGDAGTFARGAIRGLSDLSPEKRAELGITPGMDVFEQIAAIEKLMPATEEPLAQTEFLKKYFGDSREYEGIQAGVNFGVRGGLFKMADEEAAAVTGRTDVEAVDRFRKGEGARSYREAELAAERVAAGRKFDPVEQLKIEAEAQLTKEGRFEDMTGIGDMIRGIQPGAPSIKDQLINERAYKLARERAGEDNIFTEFKAFGEEQAVIDKMILETLKSIEAKTPDGANRPLAAPPPDPPSRQ